MIILDASITPEKQIIMFEKYRLLRIFEFTRLVRCCNLYCTAAGITSVITRIWFLTWFYRLLPHKRSSITLARESMQSWLYKKILKGNSPSRKFLFQQTDIETCKAPGISALSLVSTLVTLQHTIKHCKLHNCGF